MNRAATLSTLFTATLCALLCVLAAGAPAQPVQPAAPDPLSGDARLQARRSVRELSVSLRDFLADLNEQTGISFFADPSVADEKITLIAHDRPLADVLRTVSA